jgi:pimeloyl-ACP methyl ester carboxylesterase
MELMHGRPLTGPGLRAFEADHAGTPTIEVAGEPEGYLVAMDGGVRIHFLDWGGPSRATGESGATPGVLLIHGLAQTAWSWAPVARRLRTVARVAAMDARGHGLSDAPTAGYEPDQLAEDAIAVAEGAGLLAFADDAGAPGGAGPRPFVVAGHGYGAAIAAWTANALGERCAGLVLVDGGWTDLPAETGMSPDDWLAAIAEPPEVLRSQAAWLADREGFDPATWGPDQERAARAEVVETAAGRVKLAIHPHALAGSVGALWAYDPADVLTAVDAEIVALAARDDDAGRHLAGLREMAAARAAGGRSPIRAASFPGLGHNLMRYVPGAVVAAIRAAAGPPPGSPVSPSSHPAADRPASG